MLVVARRRSETNIKMAVDSDYFRRTKCQRIKINNNNNNTQLGYKGYDYVRKICLITLTLILSCNTCYGFLLDGSQTSFAQFRKWYTGLNGSLELEFKTEIPNGLVVYTDDGGTYDFFELKLVEGALRLRYNLGGGAQIITVGRELHDGHWHKVQVSFFICITRTTPLSVSLSFVIG